MRSCARHPPCRSLTWGSVTSSVQLMATTPGRMKQAMLSTWPLTTSVSPAMPFHSQITCKRAPWW